MRASPVITVEVTGYWLTLRSSGGLPQPMVHRLDWLPPNGATSVSSYMLTSVNRKAITRRGKNVMRYYAATAAPFNEMKRGLRAKGSHRLIPCRRNQYNEFNALVRQLRTSIVPPFICKSTVFATWFEGRVVDRSWGAVIGIVSPYVITSVTSEKKRFTEIFVPFMILGNTGYQILLRFFEWQFQSVKIMSAKRTVRAINVTHTVVPLFVLPPCFDEKYLLADCDTFHLEIDTCTKKKLLESIRKERFCWKFS